MKQHKIELKFKGDAKQVQDQVQLLLDELGSVGVAALVDAYQNSAMIRKQVKSKVASYQKKQQKASKKHPSAFDKLSLV